MRLIDTHSHLYVEDFDADRDLVMRRAKAVGVDKMLLPAIDSQHHERMLDICRVYPDKCMPMIGLHPTSINDNPQWRDELAQVERHLESPPSQGFCAIGEIGLDFYWSKDFKSEQIEALRCQIELALKYDLPVVIHTRDAWEEMSDIISKYRNRGLRGVFHAFSDTAGRYTQMKEYGDFVFGIGGVLTFKNSALTEVVSKMRLEDVVLETDCPYLTPSPHRGKRNESSYISYICAKVAALKGVTEDEVAQITTLNAERIFKLK